MNYCQHFKLLNHTKIPITQDPTCLFCKTKSPFLWMCLNKNCGQFVCENNKWKHMYQHQQQIKNQIHSIFINIQTGQIKCLVCKIEIYDLNQLQSEQYQKYRNCLDPFNIRIKYLPKNILQCKYQNFGQFQNSEAHKKSRRGLCGLYDIHNSLTITSVIQFISNIPYYRQVLKHSKLNSNKNQNIKVLFQLSNIIKKIWAGQSRAIQIHEFKKICMNVYPKIKGYKRKDPVEIFLFLLNNMHEQYKFYDTKIQPNMLIQSQNQDQWKIIEGLGKKYTQISPIKIHIINQMQYLIHCKICKQNKKLRSQFLQLELQIPKTRKQIKVLQNEFGKHKYQSPIKKRRRSLIDRLLGTPEEEPPITLLQLIINYTDNKNILDDNIKKCQKCNGNYEIKDSKYVKLPNILILKIQRLIKDGYGIDMREVDYPTNVLNLRGFVKQDYQRQTLYEFSSAICLNKQKQFLTIAKNSKNKQLYQFKNQNVKISTQKYIPYILCYVLKNKNNTLYHNIKSNVKLQILPQMPIPQFWLQQLKYFQPIPLLNPKICKHNRIKPMIESKIQKISYIPAQIYQALIEKYGGKLFQNIQCESCYKQLASFNLRKKKQKQAINKFDSYKCKAHAMISITWLSSWTEYLYKKHQYNYFMKSLAPPGPINNQVLLDNNFKCRPNLKKGLDFKVINFYVWIFFKQLYGGGPEIQYKTKPQDKNKSGKYYDEIIAQEIKKKAEELRQYLSQQYYLNKQWEYSPSSRLNKTISLCSESEVFKI